MARYTNIFLHWVTFECDKEKAIASRPCEIVFVPGEALTISYQEPGIKGPVTWRGWCDEGVYRMKRETKSGQDQGHGTMHYVERSDRLEGFWWEGSYEGCWWIIVDEDPE